MFYIYVIYRKDDGYYYIGYTSDLKKRFDQHSSRQKCKLIYYEAYCVEKLARERERKLKQFGGAWRALNKRLNIKGRGRGDDFYTRFSR